MEQTKGKKKEKCMYARSVILCAGSVPAEGDMARPVSSLFHQGLVELSPCT